MPTQTDTQKQAAFTDAGLNSSQQAGVLSGQGYKPSPITSATLTPQTPIQLPPIPADTNNYSGIIASGNAILKSLGDMQAKQSAATPQPTDLSSLLEQYLGGSPTPPSATDTYKSDYATSGIDNLQSDANAKAAAVKTAQSNLTSINAQLAGINAEAQAIPIQNQKDAEGRGITAAGLDPITNGQLRDNALKALPLQAQAIAAQAQVASAQGDQTLSDNLLTQAQDHLDKVFQLQMTDLTNQYNYQKDLRDKVYQFATAQEQSRLDALQKAADQQHQDQQDAIKNAQSLAQTAIQNGQGDLAAKISALDPSSPTYRTDLAALESQFKPDALKALQITQAELNIAKTRQDIANNNISIDGSAGSSSINNDVQAILEGRNTMYNIRQTMGRTNKAAQYMQAVRDQITNIDPNFDFIASDAGGKSVSTSYVQKATGAINTVLPNIEKIVQLSDQVNRIGIKGVDALLQKGGTQINNQQVANFHEAQKLIADEIGVALGAGTVSDMKLQLGFDVTDPSVSQEVFASNMALVKEFLLNRKAGLESLRYSSPTVQGVQGSSGGGMSPFVTAPDGTQVQITD